MAKVYNVTVNCITAIPRLEELPKIAGFSSYDVTISCAE